MTTPREPSTPSRASRPSGSRRLISPDEQLTVIPWRDPIVEHARGAIRTDSDDALVWYVPIVGSIGMVMAHRFARAVADGPTIWTVADIAGTFGLGSSAGRVQTTLDRLARFDVARRRDAMFAVRLWLPPLSYQQRIRLPAYLAARWTW